MNDSPLAEYYRELHGTVLANYSLSLVKDVDGIHDMRVALKRMKAFFNLLGAVSDDFDGKKSFRPYKKISNRSGGLRDAQVQLALLEEVNKPLGLDVGAFKAHLEARETIYFEEFTAFTEQNPLAKLTKAEKAVIETLKPLSPVRIETKALGRFYNLRNNLVIAGREESLREDVLHKVRILSKEVHYTFEIVNRCMHMFEDRPDFIPEIKKVHGVLGKWHDYDVALVHLAEFFTESGTDSSKEPYSVLTKSIRENRRSLHRKFGSVIKKFCSVAVTL
jgi:CHAD domain-containing protein